MEQSKFYQIKNITEQEYTLVGCDGSVITRPIQDVDRLASAFTIQDAKDGDVLYSPCCKLLWIYKDEKTCHVGSNLTYNSGSIVINKPICIPTDVVPATREQRDLLFQKIHEAGYEWNAEKKELKKIEQKPTEDVDLPEFESYLCLMFQKFRAKGMCTNGEIIDYVKEHSQKLRDILVKPAWSKEDELMISRFNNCIGHYYADNFITKEQQVIMEDWLKYLKDRVQQQKQEWNEEDAQYLLVCKNALAKYQVSDKWDATIISRWLEDKLKSIRPQNNITDEELAQAKKEAYNDALNKIEYNSGEPTFDDGWSAAIWYLKKKNGRPQNTWKPSDEQMNWFRDILDFHQFSSEGQKRMQSLYDDLKKLK